MYTPMKTIRLINKIIKIILNSYEFHNTDLLF